MKKTYIVARDAGFVYAAIPKVACGSIKRAIAPTVGLDSSRHDIHKDSFGWELASPLDVSKSSLFRFGFVRNPFDRLLSCYVHKVSRFRSQLERSPLFNVPTDWSFDRFVEWAFDRKPHSHYAPQVKVLMYEGTLLVDFVGRFEQLEEDWFKLADKFGLEPLKLSNKTSHEPYRRVYTPRLRHLAENYYERDLETFNYHF